MENSSEQMDCGVVQHHGLAAVLAAAYAPHPERFPRGPPKPHTLPNAVWINDPARLSTSQRTAR
ncbi:hypothetical protein [Corallococcus terminator]|uniref:hypothetical protein n=1 Tax=Corallococcus terminator TaxID=2316733 RepID=UPI0011C42EB2|nr:hypothetical protein [Corallococcus terminator]